MGERHIIDPIVNNLGTIDPAWAGAEFIHQAQLGRGSGYVDLLVLPKHGQHRLVLVEAKRLKNPDSSAKVIGQLLKYYAHARRLGRTAVERLRVRAAEIRQDGGDRKQWSARALLAPRPNDSLVEALEAGDPHRADEIALVVGLDGYDEALARRLDSLVTVLAQDHCLPIHVVQVRGQIVERVSTGGALDRS